MSERYTKLFALQKNLYAVGSPVILSAGHLLKDNETGRMLAQLKIKNIAAKTIKAAKVRLHPQDTTGKPLDGTAEREYLDLQAKTGDEFGQKAAIALPNASTRAFSAEVIQVVFADNSVWEETDAVWKPLPEAESLEKAFGDGELVEQYKIRYGSGSRVLSQEYCDIWLCSCGTWNRGEACYTCGSELQIFLTLDLAELIEEKDERIAREKARAERRRKAAEAAKKAAAKRIKRILSITIPAAIVCAAALLLTTKLFIPNSRYNKAIALAEAGQYGEAIAAFAALDGYKDSTERIVALFGKITEREELSAGGCHTVGLCADGGVMAAGHNDEGQCNVSDWTDIVEVSAGDSHTVGLRADGKVVAAGENKYGQCSASRWTDMVAVSAGDSHTVGLRADGTVVAVGRNEYGQCSASHWTDMVAVSAGSYHTVGLRADGTVVAAGRNEYGRCDVSDWKDIVAVSAGGWHTVGLRADGTVVATGYNDDGRCDVSDWKDIVAVSAGRWHTVGLRADGTVVAAGWDYYDQCDVSDWTDIVAISAGKDHTVGLRADGTVVATGNNGYGQCDVSDWTDIVIP